MAHVAFSKLEHRPWPLPHRAWSWRQSWLDLLFIHWPIPTALLRPLVPRGLAIQECDGTSWIGVVPFRMEGVSPRHMPDIAFMSVFPELNVRLYVEAESKAGVWFLSLDATNPVAVWAARRLFHLPYYRASMSITKRGGEFAYSSHRRGDAADFVARYRPIGEEYAAKPGTLEHFLTERYCLYARSPAGALYRNDVHHGPWPLYRADASIEVNTMLTPHGLEQPTTPPLLHFAPRVDVVVWNAELVAVT